MIDTLSLLISHGAILLAAWRLLSRTDLDCDPDSQCADRTEPRPPETAEPHHHA